MNRQALGWYPNMLPMDQDLIRIRNRINKPLTPEDRERHARIRAEIEKEKPRLTELGRQIRRRHEARQARLKQAVAELKAAREQLGLSLAEVGERTGIGKSNLSRLEKAPDPNPTIDTLNRYAEAVGKEIVITLAEKE